VSHVLKIYIFLFFNTSVKKLIKEKKAKMFNFKMNHFTKFEKEMLCNSWVILTLIYLTPPLSLHIFSCLAIKKTPTLLQTLHLHTHTPHTRTSPYPYTYTPPTHTHPTHCVYFVLVRLHRYVLLFIINLKVLSDEN
jgi:hypothetical protein